MKRLFAWFGTLTPRKVGLMIVVITLIWSFVGLVALATATTGAAQTASLTAAVPTKQPIHDDGTYFSNDGDSIAWVENGSAAVVYVTITTPYEVGGLAVADCTFTVPATTGVKFVGPFNTTWFNESSGTYRGKTKIEYTPVNSPNVTCAFISVP